MLQSTMAYEDVAIKTPGTQAVVLGAWKVNVRADIHRETKRRRMQN